MPDSGANRWPILAPVYPAVKRAAATAIRTPADRILAHESARRRSAPWWQRRSRSRFTRCRRTHGPPAVASLRSQRESIAFERWRYAASCTRRATKASRSAPAADVSPPRARKRSWSQPRVARTDRGLWVWRWRSGHHKLRSPKAWPSRPAGWTVPSVSATRRNPPCKSYLSRNLFR